MHWGIRYSIVLNRWKSWDAFVVCHCGATVYGKGHTARSAQGAAAANLNAHVQRERARAVV